MMASKNRERHLRGCTGSNKRELGASKAITNLELRVHEI